MFDALIETKQDEYEENFDMGYGHRYYSRSGM